MPVVEQDAAYPRVGVKDKCTRREILMPLGGLDLKSGPNRGNVANG
jgi:hypothetical protein